MPISDNMHFIRVYSLNSRSLSAFSEVTQTMRNIPAAMTWELLAHGRWALATAALTMLALPVMVIGMFSSMGGFNPNDPSLHMLHLIFLQTNVAMCIGVLLALSAQLTPRLYAHPARTSTFVAGRVLPAVALLTADLLIWTTTLNALCGMDWPVWEPILFAVATAVASYAALWVFYGSPWMIFALAGVAGVFSYWFKLHHGSASKNFGVTWVPIVPLEALGLLTITAICYRLVIVGLARQRRGEPPLSLGIAARIEKLLERLPRRTASLLTPRGAQRWYFDQRTWVTPVAVFAIIFFGVVLWVLVNREPSELVRGLAGGSLSMSIVALLGGMAIGAIGSKGDLAMGQFLATRPIATADMARSFWQIAATSVLLAWVVWGVVMLVVLLALSLAGESPLQALPSEFNWRTVSASVLGSWIAMGMTTSIALTGRPRLIARTFFGLAAIGIASMLLAKYALTPTAIDHITPALLAGLGVAATLGSAGAFVVAKRRRLIGFADVWASLACWLALVAVMASTLPEKFSPPLSVQMLLFGSLALAIVPIAAIPLALAWNRTR